MPGPVMRTARGLAATRSKHRSASISRENQAFDLQCMPPPAVKSRCHFATCGARNATHSRASGTIAIVADSSRIAVCIARSATAEFC